VTRRKTPETKKGEKTKKKTKRENPRRTEGRPAGDEAFPGNDPRSFFERRREGTFRSRASQRLAKGVGEREGSLSPKVQSAPLFIRFREKKADRDDKKSYLGSFFLSFFFPPRGFRIRRKAERLFFFSKKTRKELACGSQAFIATLLFDPSMSALPIIAKQNSPSVGLFTH